MSSNNDITIHCSCWFRPDLPFPPNAEVFCWGFPLTGTRIFKFWTSRNPLYDVLTWLTRRWILLAQLNKAWIKSGSVKGSTLINFWWLKSLSWNSIKLTESISLQFSFHCFSLTEQRFFFWGGGDWWCRSIHSTVDCALSFLRISIFPLVLLYVSNWTNAVAAWEVKQRLIRPPIRIRRPINGLSSWKHNISCYYFDFKTCTVQTDAEIPQPGNQLSFMLHELPLFLECHSQIASHPYMFALYTILQLYVADAFRCSIISYWCSSNENSHRK